VGKEFIFHIHAVYLFVGTRSNGPFSYIKGLKTVSLLTSRFFFTALAHKTFRETFSEFSLSVNFTEGVKNKCGGWEEKLVSFHYCTHIDARI
jgi:hypothetical protein